MNWDKWNPAWTTAIGTIVMAVIMLLGLINFSDVLWLLIGVVKFITLFFREIMVVFSILVLVLIWVNVIFRSILSDIQADLESLSGQMKISEMVMDDHASEIASLEDLINEYQVDILLANQAEKIKLLESRLAEAENIQGYQGEAVKILLKDFNLGMQEATRARYIRLKETQKLGMTQDQIDEMLDDDDG